MAKNVDHGKTTLCDFLRKSKVAEKEPGLITQNIYSFDIPLQIIKELCGDLLNKFKLDFTIPGLLIIDTPGHAVFSNLRKRGGSIADLAILVIDINQGVQPQTKEAIQILKTFKVPFIIAANKVDMINGWKSHSNIFAENIKMQLSETNKYFDKLFYTIVGQISEIGFNSNFYDKVEDYRKEIAIIPVSAKTGEGIAELLTMLTGLSQKFLGERLETQRLEGCKGTVLEIKEEKGMGTVADIIVYDGVLKKEDYIVIGGLNEVVETKVRSLFKPLPLSEIRDKKSGFSHVDEVQAAAGVRVLAPDLDKAMAGAPIVSSPNKEDLEAAKQEILEEVQEVLIETQESGIILKCDTLGSLEAITKLIQDKGFRIKYASIGNINKLDIMMAKSVQEQDPLDAFVLGFNVGIQDGTELLAKEYKIPIITEKIVYHLIDKFEEALEKKRKQIELEQLEGLTWPVKVQILQGYIFRQSNPAVFGVEVLGGKLKSKIELIDSNCKIVGEIKTIEDQGNKLEEVGTGEKVAISVDGLTIGRQASAGDTLYSNLSEDNFRILKTRKHLLSPSDINVMKEIAQLHRKEKETWGL